jgi:hypothetical protein
LLCRRLSRLLSQKATGKKEIGYHTGTIDWIEVHDRLLRSLSWGDGDYGGHVFDALRMLRLKNRGLDLLLKNPPIVKYLRKNAPELYSKYVDSSEPVPEFVPKALTPKETGLGEKGRPHFTPRRAAGRDLNGTA